LSNLVLLFYALKQNVKQVTDINRSVIHFRFSGIHSLSIFKKNCCFVLFYTLFCWWNCTYLNSSCFLNTKTHHLQDYKIEDMLFTCQYNWHIRKRKQQSHIDVKIPDFIKKNENEDENHIDWSFQIFISLSNRNLLLLIIDIASVCVCVCL
jgi:hypothetical protein